MIPFLPRTFVWLWPEHNNPEVCPRHRLHSSHALVAIVICQPWWPDGAGSRGVYLSGMQRQRWLLYAAQVVETDRGVKKPEEAIDVNMETNAVSEVSDFTWKPLLCWKSEI